LLRRLALGWGPLGLSGNATLALDTRLQPVGSATARVVGYVAMLDALVASGALTPSVAQAVKGILGLLAGPPASDGSPQVELPLKLRDRTLAVGPIPLLRMPELLWP